MFWRSSSQSFQSYFRFSIRYISSNVDDCHEYHLVYHDAIIIHLLESGNCGGNKHMNFQVQKCPYNHLHNNFSHISVFSEIGKKCLEEMVIFYLKVIYVVKLDLLLRWICWKCFISLRDITRCYFHQTHSLKSYVQPCQNQYVPKLKHNFI